MMHRKKKRAIIGFVFVAIFLLLLFFSVARFFAAIEEKRRYLEEKAQIQPRPPNLFTLTRQTLPQVRRFSADILPWMEAEVAPEVSGTVSQILVERGDSVSDGDPMVQLDSELAAAQLKAAEARAAESARLLDEVRKLSQRDVAARTELEAAMASLAIAEAELGQARIQYERHAVGAPFDGRVNDRYVDVGDTVQPGSPVAEVVDLSRLRVVFHVSELEVGAFQPGTPLDLRVVGRPERVFHPKVRFLSPSADPATRLFRVEAVLENPEAALPGGMQGEVVAEIAVYEDMLFLPAAAVRLSGRTATVAVRTGSGGFETREVALGPEIDGMYPVLEGLKEGDTIVIR